MIKNTYHILGIMSGTSLDGVDIAQCLFTLDTSQKWSFTILKTKTIAYPKKWVTQLKKAIGYSQDKIDALNVAYTTYLANCINQFIERYQLKNIDAVCSHGHTILHQPHKGITLQIGNLQLLANILNQRVVCDFRVQDVALGGQGAPLVPIGDALLFSEYNYCLNLGGFANVSYQSQNKRIAFDICPVNIVLNFYAEKLGFSYDEGGKIAQLGVCNEPLLKKLNALEYYSKNPPKSLGLEWVQENIFPLLENAKETPQNILATFVYHIAQQLTAHFKQNEKVLITGGGVYNSFLIKSLQQKSSAKFIIPNDKIIQFKEALVFAFLGVLKLRNENNCLASVTGANKDHSSGIVFLPHK